MARPKGSRNAIQPTKEQQEMLQQVSESTLSTKIRNLTHPKKQAAIETYYATNGNVSATTRAVKIERKTWYNWLESDPLFFELVEEQKAEVLDKLKAEALKRALDDTKQNDTMLIFNLKSLHPEYKPQKETIAFQNDGMRFVLSRGN